MAEFADSAECPEPEQPFERAGAERLHDYLMLARLGVRMHVAGASTQAAYESMRTVLAQDGETEWLDAALPQLRRSEPLVAQFALRTARNVLSRVALPRMRRDCLLLAVPVWLAPGGSPGSTQAWRALGEELVGHLGSQHGLEPDALSPAARPRPCEVLAQEALSLTAVRALALASAEETAQEASAGTSASFEGGPQVWPLAVTGPTETISTLQSALGGLMRTDAASQRWCARAESLLERSGVTARVGTPTTWENAFSAARLLGLRQALMQARAKGLLPAGARLMLEHSAGHLLLRAERQADGVVDLRVVLDAPFPDETVEDLRRIVQLAARSMGLAFEAAA